MKVHITGIHTLDFPDEASHPDPNNLDKKIGPYFHYLFNKKLRKDMSVYTWCWERMLRRIRANGGVKSAAEYFGGAGRATVMIQKILAPERHFVMDYDRAQYEWLLTLKKDFPSLDVFHGDAYKEAGAHPAELVCLDIPHCTIRSLVKEPAVRGMLALILAKKPRWVQLADSSLGRLQLQRKTYSQLSGVKITTKQDYLRAVSEVARREFGYVVDYAAYYWKVSCTLLVPQEFGSTLFAEDARDFPESFEALRFEA